MKSDETPFICKRFEKIAPSAPRSGALEFSVPGRIRMTKQVFMLRVHMGTKLVARENPWLMSKISHIDSISLRPDSKVPGKGGITNAFLPALPLRHPCLYETVQDSHKLPEPSACALCAAVYRKGQWQWSKSVPADIPETICPACHQIRYNLPTGFITLSGDFIKMNRPAVLNLIREHERGERAQHPLHRLISIEEYPDKLLVTTTDTHLPKRIGRAMYHACKGWLTMHYEVEIGFIRVNWTSDADPNRKSNPTRKRKKL